MEPRSLKYVCAALNGEQLTGSPDLLVKQVCTDSRRVQAGDLFFALAGEKFDGHDFVLEAAQNGAAAVIVERAKAPHVPGDCAVIVVEETRPALGALAARYRQDFDLPIVAVAGSNGKTTTKELIGSVLREGLEVLTSEASFNNDIGVPRTLLNLHDKQRAAVLEAGTNHRGELAPLIRMIRPTVGVLTGIGREHLEFFGNLDGVAEEEGWLAELLAPEGTLILNGDSEWTDRIARRARAAVVRVGFGKDNDWRVSEVRADASGVSFNVDSPRKAFNRSYGLKLLGRHQAVNALMAVVVGAHLGLTPEDASRGLARCQAPKMRLQLWETNGVRVLDDSYNANADSMLAALQTLHELPTAGARVAVLGDMAELGAQSAAAHAEIGRRAAELKLTWVIAVGKQARQIADAAQNSGLSRVSKFPDVASAATVLGKAVRPGDIVLLKGSRTAGVERVGELLRSLLPQHHGT